jgi:hypothetical protein
VEEADASDSAGDAAGIFQMVDLYVACVERILSAFAVDVFASALSVLPVFRVFEIAHDQSSSAYL